MLLEKSELPGKAVTVLPASATMLYGLICLLLNALRLIDGPYFFLQVYDQPASVIVMWFAIIAVLCIGLAFLYRFIRIRTNNVWSRQNVKRLIICMKFCVSIYSGQLPEKTYEYSKNWNQGKRHKRILQGTG